METARELVGHLLVQPVVPPSPGETVAIHVTPKSSKDAVDGWVEDAAGTRWLKVRLTAAPEDGKANKALLRLLAKEWGIAHTRLSIISGKTSRKKMVRLD